MKSIYTFIFMSLTILMTISKSYGHDNFPVLKGPYLGQNPPGKVAEVFAPGIVSTQYFEAFGVFTPNLKEFYFVRGGEKNKKHTLVVIKYENNRWIESVVAPRVGEPFISPDGKIMYLGKKYMERTDSGWSEVKILGVPFEEIRIMRLTASSKGIYVFDEATKDGNGALRYSRLVDGKREKPKILSKEINTGKWNAHPFIAPDESYLIWDGEREDGYGESDLYISFRQKDASWGPAINLGNNINSQFEDAFGSVTPDGKYFFFYRTVSPGNLDIFWADAQFIETLRPK
ncbi:PD40 domain-containing protein [Pseudoalteromonas denitrificans]|uniref:WD40-like Beta Propeller Repeat n=1 Tax=Pseudoalteromonas denitrificans DSM 6059 TaxID=1123010 RepID=A0A1I1S7X1_9GAMM|nr:PD40 domain-containing protein [Pseudoalteromonas denitrificans]SFD42497.1 WD40-like Beta Propeller Repeat [Pseudoalteromonas denitrificans DSM 6059]